VQAALDNGTRGLRGGSSLAQLLQECRGARNKSNLPRLTEAGILAWADAHYQRTGRYPVVEAGPIADAPGETWKAVHMALVEGLRGLPGGWTLARLLKVHRGVVNRGGHWMKAERPCWCCEDRLGLSIEPCDCSIKNCARCGLCSLHCECRKDEP
jgi:hypothetical protein